MPAELGLSAANLKSQAVVTGSMIDLTGAKYATAMIQTVQVGATPNAAVFRLLADCFLNDGVTVYASDVLIGIITMGAQADTENYVIGWSMGDGTTNTGTFGTSPGTISLTAATQYLMRGVGKCKLKLDVTTASTAATSATAQVWLRAT